MSVSSTDGLRVLMSNGTPPETIEVTEVTNAKPAVAIAADTTGMADGQLVTMSGTGLKSIDGKTFAVGQLTGITFELVGSDASGEAAEATSGTAAYYDDDTDMVDLCLATITPNVTVPASIPVPTFCDSTQQVPGNEPPAGDVGMTLYLDIEDPGYCALLDAEKDRLERMFKIEFPNNGVMEMEGVVSSIQFTSVPLEGSVELTATVTLSAKPVHLFDCP